MKYYTNFDCCRCIYDITVFEEEITLQIVSTNSPNGYRYNKKEIRPTCAIYAMVVAGEVFTTIIVYSIIIFDFSRGSPWWCNNPSFARFIFNYFYMCLIVPDQMVTADALNVVD